MVVFTQKINGVTGTLEWDAKDDEYDYHQEIARAAFADMLHDEERNKKYFSSLKAAIEKMHSQGKSANVLDIGTGTGLLSIMAAQCGADTIIACEAFKPMSECALEIIKDNGFEHLIQVIPKRSTDLTVGENGDIEQRANILVTEVFDTELIGEGALETFTHAHQVLLEEDCIVVPHSATIYAQVVECPTLQRWNKLMDVADEDGDIIIKIPDTIKNCNGSAAVHDIQLSQLEPYLFKEITKPVPVLNYDWSGKKPLLKNTSSTIKAVSTTTATAQMVFVWWDLIMDTEGKIVLNCAPWWNHPDADKTNKYPQDTIPWRDHWMQAVYYFPSPISVKQGDDLTLVSSQDEYSLWFNLVNNCNLSNDSKVFEEDLNLRPICNCGVHMTYSRTHVAYLNDNIRNKKMLRVLKENVSKDDVVLCLNGSSMMGLAVAKMGAKSVIYLESGIIGGKILKNCIEFNNLINVKVVKNLEDVFKSGYREDVTVVLGDPDYTTSLLPWDNLHSAHIVHKYKEKLNNDKLKVIPGKCTLWTMAVEFLDLHKIKTPLNICENIDLKLFDQLIMNSRSKSDDDIEPQPLWEYPCICKSEPLKILDVDLQHTQEIIISDGSAKSPIGTKYNAFVFWVEWDLNGDGNEIVSTGPVGKVMLNERFQWDRNSRQGVLILEQSKCVEEGQSLKYKVKCNLLSGSMDIYVSIM